MNMIAIDRALREPRLCGIAVALCTRMTQAQAAQQPFLETFAATRTWPRPWPVKPSCRDTTFVPWKPTPSSPVAGWPAWLSRPNNSKAGYRGRQQAGSVSINGNKAAHIEDALVACSILSDRFAAGHSAKLLASQWLDALERVHRGH